MSVNTTWSLEGGPYLLVGDVILLPGRTLTVEAGVKVLFLPFTDVLESGNWSNRSELTIGVGGTLTAVGTPDNPVSFTSTNAPPQPGDWDAVRFDSGAGGTMSHCQVSGAVFGVYTEGTAASPTVESCVFTDNQYGIYAVSQSSPTITGDGNYGIYLAGSYSLATINNNNLHDNGRGYDLFSRVTSEVDARFNYWGLTTTAIMNIGGNPKDIPRIYDSFNNTSYGLVNYSGWLETHYLSYPTAIRLTPGSGSLLVEWHAAAGAAGYNIKYGTASGVYDVTIDAGDVESYLITGLANGTTYYVALSSYDGDGNEGPESRELTGTPQPWLGNTSPVANGQTVDTSEDRSVDITLTGSDEDDDPLTFIITSLPLSGDLSEGVTTIDAVIHTLTGDTVTYTPHSGFIGTDSLSFRTNDGIVDSTAATVMINVAEGRHLVNGTVRLEGMAQPLTGVILTIASSSEEDRMFTDPTDVSFEIRLLQDTYDMTVEKDGFLTAVQRGLFVNQNITLPEVVLLWGDTGNGIIDVGDLVLLAKNQGKTESPWRPPDIVPLVISLLPATQTVIQGTPVDLAIQLDPRGVLVDGAEITVEVEAPLQVGGVNAGEGVTITGISFGEGVIEFSVTFAPRTDLLTELATVRVNTPAAVSPEGQNVAFLNTGEQRTVGKFEGGDVPATLEGATIVVTP